MKITIALLVLCSLQSSLVLAKTVENIIEDLQPIIAVLHDELSIKANDIYRDALNIINHFETRARWQENRVNEHWTEILVDINAQFETIINETGMTDRPDKIEHCYDQTNTEYARFYDMERSGVEVVKGTTEYAAHTLREVVRTIRDLQNPLHDSINTGPTHCKDQADTPVDMQLCLINHYTLSQTAIRHLLETMDISMEKVKENVGAKYSIIDNAFDIIIKRVIPVSEPVVEVFRKCCIAASQTS